MPDLPPVLADLHRALTSLDAELTQSRVLLRDLQLPLRLDTVADYEQRLVALEALARALGLETPDRVRREQP